MKNLISSVLIIAAALLASCNVYQVNMLSSTNIEKDTSAGVFYFENDSVKISYSFYGNNAPVSVKVYNKTSKPLYIDWKQSALIVGDNAISYTANKIDINGKINAVTQSFDNINRRSLAIGPTSFTSASLNAQASLPKEMTFLPPNSQSTNASITLTQKFLHVPDSLKTNERLAYATSKVDVKSVDFNVQNSPLMIKSFLTLYLVDGNETHPMTYQHDFFVSKSYITSVDPNYLNILQGSRGDYYISKKSE